MITNIVTLVNVRTEIGSGTEIENVAVYDQEIRDASRPDEAVLAAKKNLKMGKGKR